MEASVQLSCVIRETSATAHMQEALRVVRYLKDTRDYALELGGRHDPIEGSVDGVSGGDLDTRISITGVVCVARGEACRYPYRKGFLSNLN